MSSLIEFKLFAPYNRGAVLIGDFSDWKEIPMQKDDRGYFRTEVELEDGVYQYKFRVQSRSEFRKPDEWVEINDPWVRELDGKTKNGVARIKEGRRILDTYVWQHDGKPLPPNEELIIYELFIGDFSGDEGDTKDPGQYKGVIEKLDYLCELGINAIELMPVNACPSDYGWGYTPSYHFATQPSYGFAEDLKRLIDECHARGIRVILDQLYNHSSEECPLHQIDRDYWYYRDRHHPEDPYYWGPEFNYQYCDEKRNTCPAKDYMGEVVRFWVQEYHPDGIRFDALKQLDNWDFLHWISGEAKKAAGGKPFYNIGEQVPENVELVTEKGPMDGCWHDSFYHFLQPVICGDAFEQEQLINVLDPKRQGYPEGITKVINYITNHDQERLITSLGDRGIFDDAAFNRVKLGAAILMTAPGIPLIWMGQEFGECKHREPNKPQKLEWALLKNDRNRDLLEYYKRLIAFRKQTPALKTPHIDFFHANPEEKILAYVRWDDAGSQVIVVANFSDQSFEQYQLPNFPANGTWRDWAGNGEVEAADSQLTVELPAWDAKIFTR